MFLPLGVVCGQWEHLRRQILEHRAFQHPQSAIHNSHTGMLCRSWPSLRMCNRCLLLWRVTSLGRCFSKKRLDWSMMSHLPACLGCLQARAESSEVPCLSKLGLLQILFCFLIIVFSWYTCLSDFVSLTLLFSVFVGLFLVEIWCWVCQVGGGVVLI